MLTEYGTVNVAATVFAVVWAVAVVWGLSAPALRDLEPRSEEGDGTAVARDA